MESTETGVKEGKPKKSRDEIMEIIVVVLLGLVTLLTAWATWIGSLHGGNQATNYTKSNNIAADGNSRWNQASQDLLSDMQLVNRINDLRIELTYAEENGDAEEAEKCQWKIDEIIGNSASEELVEAMQWADAQEEYATPFDMEGFTESYFEDAEAVLAEADEVLKQGQKDNASGDAYGLVTVIYSIVLFLLGISSSFKSGKNKMALIIIGAVGTALATAYMLTLPMPTGFSLSGFFGG